MTNRIKIVGVVSAGILLAGCAHVGHRVNEADALKTRVDALESQLASVNQRLDEIAANPSAPSSSAAPGTFSGGRTSASTKTRLSVRQVQKALIAAGYYKGTVDGKEGPQTKKAIKAFQQAQGLKADGVAGAATSETLAKYLNE